MAEEGESLSLSGPEDSKGMIDEFAVDDEFSVLIFPINAKSSRHRKARISGFGRSCNKKRNG